LGFGLGFLNQHGNNLTSIDISNNLYLEQLDCSDNDLTSLDVSNNISLISLGCQSNPLTCIKVNQSQLDNFTQDWGKDPEDYYSLDCN
jgi:Leucine-rich repeat (LRR) protein